MRRFAPAVILAGLFAPQPVLASDYCDALWVHRNMLFHRAGYCFASQLGQSLFGNAGCMTADAGALQVNRAEVARLREYEGWIGCRTSTSRNPTAAMRSLKARLDRLIDIPEPIEGGFACWGYTGPAFALHAGTGAGTPVIGRMDPGLSAITEYWPKNGWTYIVVSTGPGGSVVAEGWTTAQISDRQCRAVAG
ncbi:MAG: DUF4453 domain-containing protein [Gemmobacter sp.]